MKPLPIQTFRGGISDETDKGIKGSFKHGYALEIHGRADSLTCKFAMQRIDDAATLTDLCNFFVTASDGSTYAFGDSGKIYAIAGNAYDHKITLKLTGANGKIKGAAEWKTSDGNDYLWWSTDTSVARKLLPGDDAWGDASENYKTTLNSADWHPMKIATGSLCIGNGNAVATIDYDGNFNALAANIRPGNTIRALEERDDYLLMGSGRLDQGEEGHLWSWITTAIDYVQKKRVPAKGVNAISGTEIYLAQAGGNGELFYSDFKNVIPVHAIPGGGQSSPGSVAIEKNIALFGIYGGTYPGIWGYGRSKKNRPYALNYMYRLTGTVNGSTVSTVGAVAMVNGELLAAYGTTDGSTTEYIIDSLSNTTLATARFEALEFKGNNPYMKKKSDEVKFTMSALPAGCSVACVYRFNKATSWTYALMGDNTTTFSVANATDALFNVGTDGETYEVGADLTPSGTSTPEILAITSMLSDVGYEFSKE